MSLHYTKCVSPDIIKFCFRWVHELFNIPDTDNIVCLFPVHFLDILVPDDMTSDDTFCYEDAAELISGVNVSKIDTAIILNNSFEDRSRWNLYAIFPKENRIELIDFNPKQESIDALPVLWKFIVLYYNSINVKTDIYNWKLVHSRRDTFKYNPHPEDSGLHAILNTVALIYQQKILHVLLVVGC